MNHSRRTLGDTAIEVSPICLGTMTFGNPVVRDDAIALIHWALDHGVNFIDTADMYEGYDRKPGSPGGVAETIIGDALVNQRERAIITTKVGNDVGQGSSLAPAYIQQQLDASLKRLRTDYIDVYELHRPDPNTPLVATLETMANVIAAGKVRCWGFSNYDAAQVREICALCDSHGWPLPKVSQPFYNWLNRDIEQDHLPACREFGISVTPYRPLEGGLLTGKYRKGSAIPAGSRAAESGWLEAPDDERGERIEAFIDEAQIANLTPTQYALHWLLEQSGITSVVVGVKRKAQLEDAISILR